MLRKFVCLTIIIIGSMPVIALGKCPEEPDIFEDSESARILIAQQEVEGMVFYFIHLPAQRNGKSLSSAHLIIGKYLAIEGVIPLEVKSSEKGYMTGFSLYPDFNNGAYVRATYGECDVIGKTAKARSKLPKIIIPGGQN